MPSAEETQTGRPPEGEGGGRARLLLALGLLAGLLIAGGVALAVSGEKEREFAAPPEECVTAWNEDPAALFLGKHQFGAHRYQQLEVLYLDEEGEALPESSPGARCAIIFAAANLDPEASSVVQILQPIGWAPLSRSVGVQTLGELQTAAQSDYNAILQPDGTVEPL